MSKIKVEDIEIETERELTEEEAHGYSPEYIIYNAFGMMSRERFEEYALEARHGLLMHNMPFLNAIGLALISADIHQTIKLVNAFRQECAQASWLWRIRTAKDKDK